MALTHHAETRPLALRLLTLCIEEDPAQVNSEMSRLVSWLRQLSLRKHGIALLATLRAAQTTLRALPAAADAFRRASGFQVLLNVLRHLEARATTKAAAAESTGERPEMAAPPPKQARPVATIERPFEVARACLALAVTAWTLSRENRPACHDMAFLEHAATALVSSGLLQQRDNWRDYCDVAEAVMTANDRSTALANDDSTGAERSSSHRKLQPAISTEGGMDTLSGGRGSVEVPQTGSAPPCAGSGLGGRCRDALCAGGGTRA